MGMETQPAEANPVDTDPTHLPEEFTNIVTPQDEDVDVVNGQDPEPDEDEEASA